MSIIKYNKLVRDRIPEIIQNDGKTPTTHIATDKEYLKGLLEKLSEEVEEFAKSLAADELTDILEVINALGKLQGLTLKDLEKLRIKKASKRGGFDKRIILEKVEE